MTADSQYLSIRSQCASAAGAFDNDFQKDGGLWVLSGLRREVFQCKTRVKSGAGFCPKCGEPAPGAKAICPACGTELKAAARFCGHCGATTGRGKDETSPVDSLNRWKRSADEFARRIEASDLRGTLQRGLVVEPGTHALIFQGGTLAATVAEGTYNLTRPMQGVDLAVPATAIVMDAGETRIPLLYRDLRTREEVPADVIVEVVVRLGTRLLSTQT